MSLNSYYLKNPPTITTTRSALCEHNQHSESKGICSYNPKELDSLERIKQN